MITDDFMLHYYPITFFECGSCNIRCENKRRICFKWNPHEGKVQLYNVDYHYAFLKGKIV